MNEAAYDGTEEIPFEEPVQEPEAGPAPVRAAAWHADHMELTHASGVLTAPAAWLLGGFAVLVLAMAGVLAGAAVTEPGYRTLFASAAVLLGLLGTGLAVGVLASRARFRAALARTVLDFRRTVSPQSVVFGDPVQVTLDASECIVPPNLRIRIKDLPSPGFETGRRIVMEGPDVRRYEARAQRRGQQALESVDVLLRDRAGLWRHQRTYSLATAVEVRPGTASLALRNMLTGRSAFPDGAPKALVNMFRDVDHEQLREYQGGDAMKSVDWKRMGMTGQMMVKDKIIESLDVGLLLIDAGTSMRLVDGQRRNLDSALEAASEIISEANRRNHQIGMLAFDDAHVVEEMPPTRSRMLVFDAEERFQRLARRTPYESSGTPEPVAVSLTRALRRMGGARMGVLLFSDLETIDEGIVQALSRLGGQGAKVGVMILPQPSLDAKRRAYRRHGTRPVKGQYRGKGHRKELMELLSIQGIETMRVPT